MRPPKARRVCITGHTRTSTYLNGKGIWTEVPGTEHVNRSSPIKYDCAYNIEFIHRPNKWFLSKSDVQVYPLTVSVQTRVYYYHYFITPSTPNQGTVVSYLGLYP